MRVIIIEDCTADDLTSVLHQTITGRVLSDVIKSEKDEITNTPYESEFIGEDIEVDEPCVPMPTPTSMRHYAMTPKSDEPEKPPVGHTRTWQDVETDLVSRCTSWSQAVETYKEAYPKSLRTDHAIKMRWYYLRKRGRLVSQGPAPETVSPAPDPSTSAPDVLDELVIARLIDRRCQADIPSDGGNTKYVKGYIRRVLIDRHVLIECDSGAMCWCLLDYVVLLEGGS